MTNFRYNGDDDEDRADAEVTITSEDLEGRRCGYCGCMLSFENYADGSPQYDTWDIMVSNPEDTDKQNLYNRYYFCPNSCKEVAQHDIDWLKGETRKGDYEAILEENLDGYV